MRFNKVTPDLQKEMSIAFSEVSFSYHPEQDPVISKVSLEANPGDVIGIKGSSGSGKTTLFRLLLGFETPTSGKILYKGKELKPEQIKVLRKQTSWLPQDLDLGEGPLSEVFFYPFTFKANKSKIPSKEKVLEIFAALGLNKNIWTQLFSDLSTGQRQRVGLALGYLTDKNILILDEPTSALDDESKEKVENLLFDGTRIIISASHDPWWLKRCSKVIDLNAS